MILSITRIQSTKLRLGHHPPHIKWYCRAILTFLVICAICAFDSYNTKQTWPVWPPFTQPSIAAGWRALPVNPSIAHRLAMLLNDCLPLWAYLIIWSKNTNRFHYAILSQVFVAPQLRFIFSTTQSGFLAIMAIWIKCNLLKCQFKKCFIQLCIVSFSNRCKS